MPGSGRWKPDTRSRPARTRHGSHIRRRRVSRTYFSVSTACSARPDAVGRRVATDIRRCRWASHTCRSPSPWPRRGRHRLRPDSPRLRHGLRDAADRSVRRRRPDQHQPRGGWCDRSRRHRHHRPQRHEFGDGRHGRGPRVDHQSPSSGQPGRFPGGCSHRTGRTPGSRTADAARQTGSG